MFPPGTLIAIGLYLTRTSALVLAAPVLGSGTNFSGARLGLVGILSVLLFATDGSPIPGPVGPLTFGVMAMREVLIGLSLAFVLQAVTLAVKVAGELIGHEMAFNMSNLVDPVTGINTPLVTQVYDGFFLIGLLSVDGHHLLIRALSDSFAQAPVGAIGFNPSISASVQSLFGEMFAAGMTFAAPVLVLLVLVSLLMGLLARAVPHLNVLEVGFTLRIGVGLVAMFGFAPMLAPAMGRLYESLAVALDDVLVLLGS